MRFVHLATAPDQLTAELWLSILHDAGVVGLIRPSDAVSYLGVSAMGCRVQVLEDDLERARALLEDVLVEAEGEDKPHSRA